MRDDGFPSDFLWGCSTASYQIEGGATEDGRGPSIWDQFCREPGRISDGKDGSIACDSYHRIDEDIGLLVELGVDAYRFSVAWPRVQPEGRGPANAKGLDYYSRLVDALLARGIEPWVTLYHWDLPLALERTGGWPERDTAYRFAEYAGMVYDSLGDRVKRWASLNEPWCSAFLGYRYGEHAPGKRDEVAAIRATHHLLLAHGLSAAAFRSRGVEGDFGIIINPSTPRPATRSPADAAAAHRASLERTALWLDPLFGRGYPAEYEALTGLAFPIKEGDMELIAAPIDFLGVNYYNEESVKAAPAWIARQAADALPTVKAATAEAAPTEAAPAEAAPAEAAPFGALSVPTWQEKTEMGWDVVPRGLLRILSAISREWAPKTLYVTENGAAFTDTADASGRVHDARRIDYIRGHLGACRDAIAAGIPLKGYFAWTLMDNFEWAFGYSRTFGLVSVDPDSLARTPKDSFCYYRDFIAGYGL